MDRIAVGVRLRDGPRTATPTEATTKNAFRRKLVRSGGRVDGPKQPQPIDNARLLHSAPVATTRPKADSSPGHTGKLARTIATATSAPTVTGASAFGKGRPRAVSHSTWFRQLIALPTAANSQTAARPTAKTVARTGASNIDSGPTQIVLRWLQVHRLKALRG